MFRRNSIFTKTLVPVIIIMLLQTVLISLVVLFYGVTASLDRSAVGSMHNNAETRGAALADKMVSAWSNLDWLEYGILRELDAFLKETGMTIFDLVDDYELSLQALERLPTPMLNALRVSTSTGVFFYYAGEYDVYEQNVIKLRSGLYYRDLDPLSTPADSSDILFLRGPASIARKDRIPMDSFWTEAFVFSPSEEAVWNTFYRPQRAAHDNPSFSARDLGYWSMPLFITSNARDHSNRCITYTRPLFYEGQLFAMIGTEVQINYLERFLSPSDFSFEQSGYMLIKYSREQYESEQHLVDCTILMTTGSYISRLLSGKQQVRLRWHNRNGAYTMEGESLRGLQVTMVPLRMYNTNAPFSDEQWAVAAVGTESKLFEMSSRVWRGILQSSAVALVIGTTLLFLTVQRSIRPLTSIADQIMSLPPSEPILLENTDAYEISLLHTTINAMREDRTRSEALLRSERERYLVALERIADTVIEYSLPDDCFTMYYFSEDAIGSSLRSREVTHFSERIASGVVCHPDDVERFLYFLKSLSQEEATVRIRSEVFTHVDDLVSDDGYCWFLIKAKRMFNDAGALLKFVGAARDITCSMLEEFAIEELSRRDVTTCLFNHESGLIASQSAANAAAQQGESFAVAYLSVDNFDEVEAYYGRVFAASILMEAFNSVTPSDFCMGTRLANDEFLLCFRTCDREEVATRLRSVRDALTKGYTGENREIGLRVSVGAAMSDSVPEFDAQMNAAMLAGQYAARNAKTECVFFADLPDDERHGHASMRDRPIGASLDVAKESVTGYAFELFERTGDVHSAVNMVLTVLGRLYELRQVIVCGFDADFGAGQVTHCWNARGVPPHHRLIERVSLEDLTAFEAMMDDNGTLVYTNEQLAAHSEGIRRMFCCQPELKLGGYCCVMHENNVQSGRVLYQLPETRSIWCDSDLVELYEVSKIIAANLSIERSTSASRAKSEFLSHISHEIRTPMNAIIGMTDIAKRSAAEDPERLLDALGKIDFSAKHLLSLINDVLEMSRIESGKLKLDPIPFSLLGFTQDVDTLLRPMIEGKGIRFVIDCQTGDRRVLGDEYRLRQVIVNLLSNANKFTQPGGVVTFSLVEEEQEEAHGHYRFSVRDTGIGIAPEDQPTIFRAFEQARASSTIQKSQGTGLGLAISGSIIAEMGSRIGLESKPGVGSEFFFTLQLPYAGQAHAETEAQTDAEETPSAGLEGKHVLLVEDNEINAEIASFILEEFGLNIEMAINGQEAVDKFLASPCGHFDIILMDIQMPIMDGLTATRNIRKNTERPDARLVPIVAMTANAFDEDMKKSVESGMNGHITKPIDVESLHQLLRKLMLNAEGDAT